jgi:phage tail sheath protein FI
MPNFLHGVNVVDVNEGINRVRTSSSSVIGVIGTAPEADTDDFPLNTPILINGSYTEARRLGTLGTLPTALDGILAQTGAMVVVIRVAEGEASGEGNEAITAAEATINNVIGSVSGNGEYNGVYSFLAAKSMLGVTPRILCAPGFSTAEVVTELNIIANRLRAIVVADCPANETNANLISFVNACASARVYAVYPQVINTKNAVVPVSPYVAGVIAKTDNDEGFWVSPSNKAINGIIGLSKPIDFTLGDSSCRANYLNEQKIATIINQNGYKLWGNRTTAGEGAYQFLCVRRAADVISESILQSHLWAVDRNIVKNYLTDVTENVNAFLATLKSQGAILAGKCVANKELNTAQNISEGKVYFDFEFTPAYPAEQVTFRAYLNNENIETVLMENLAQ